MKNAIIEWPGKHEWPDATYFTHAIFWQMLSASGKNPVLRRDSVMKKYISFTHESIATENEPVVKATLLQNAINALEGQTQVTGLKRELGAILVSTRYKQEKSRLAYVLKHENETKELLLNSFQGRDITWWKNEIKTLQADSGNESNQRLLGYISLAAWSYSTKAIAANDIPFAMRSLDIYEAADPGNSEHAFLRACLFSKNNNPDSAIYYLKRSVELGLNDRSKIENEKDLAPIRGMKGYVEAVYGLSSK
jgi:hypothetical protein